MSRILLVTQNEPSTPSTGKVVFWPGPDGVLRGKDDTGTTTNYGPASAEAIQDAVGNILTDTASIDLSYNDVLNTITATVMASGVDHNSLANYSANRHIDHSAVSITTGTGLSGGGDITATRTISIANTTVTAASYGSSSQVAAFTVNAQGQLTAASAVTITPVAIGAQPVDGDLTALAALSGTGGVYRTATDTYALRTITGTAGNITVANGDGISGNPTLDLPATGTAGTYGSATQTPVLTTDAKGRVTGVTNTNIDHNALTNFVANKHIDHSAVSISAGTGLTGGGDITTSRTISMPNVGTAGTYGSASVIPQITTDAQGRVSNVSGFAIAIPSTSITDFVEAVQDVMGGEFVDSASIDFQYNDVANTQTAVVLPTGVDHNSLANYVANRHIDHSSVSITAGTGLSGGGDITTSRTLNITNTTVTAASYGSSSQVAAFTVNAQGQLTAASAITITPAAIGAQPVDGDLTALAALSGTGGLYRTATDTYVLRTITGTAGNITVANGDGISGNPTLDLPATGTAGTYGSATQVPVLTTDAKGRVTGVTNTSITAAGIGAQPIDADLTAIAALTGTGIPARTATDTYALRTITAGTGMTVTNGAGIAGNPTITANLTTTPPPLFSAAGPSSAGTSVEMARADHSHAMNVTGVIPGAYGNSSTVPAFTVQSQGLLVNGVSGIPIDHDALTNFVANEHIDHSTVSISAGTGLSGGGDITANRTISMPNVGTAGTYGGYGFFPSFTTDAQGRVSAASSTAIATTQIQGTAGVSSTSATYATITGATATPAAGTYLVFFTCDAGVTANSNGDIALHLATVEQASTRRNIGTTDTLGTSTVNGTLSFITMIAVNGSQVLDVRLRENGSGTLTISGREFILVRIA